MKRGLILFILVFVCFVAAQPDYETYEEKYDEVKEIVDKIPLDEAGELDKEKLNKTYVFFTSRAEERINEINNWLEENVSWLRFIFRMNPEISWRFFWNLYFIGLAIAFLIFNERKTWFFFESKSSGIIYGTALFLILLFTNVYIFFADLVINILSIFYEIVLPWGFAISIILLVVFILVCIFFWPAVLSFLQFIVPQILKSFGMKIARDEIEAMINRGKEETLKTKQLNEEQEAMLGASR